MFRSIPSQGKIVRTLSASIRRKSLEGFRTPRQAIEWDGKDDFGDTVAKVHIFLRYLHEAKIRKNVQEVLLL
jgi:hypothetical protein